METVIFGISEFSEYLYHTIRIEGKINVVAFTVTKEYLHISEYCGLPVLDFDKLYEKYDSFEILISVGYQKMNTGRELVYNQCKQKGYKIGTYISTRSICDTDKIGEGCIVMPMAYIPPLKSIGVCNVVNTASILGHTSIIGDFNWFSGNVTMGGNVIVDNNCFIGMNCLLKNDIHIASQTMLGAYSYLNDDTQEGRYYSGNPAVNERKLKSRIVCDFI